MPGTIPVVMHHPNDSIWPHTISFTILSSEPCISAAVYLPCGGRDSFREVHDSVNLWQRSQGHDRSPQHRHAVESGNVELYVVSVRQMQACAGLWAGPVVWLCAMLPIAVRQTKHMIHNTSTK